jgi:threonine synthase
LAVASNKNDIVTRFLKSGTMQIEKVQPSLSPSMDIQISSNFERLLFDLCHEDGSKVESFMGQLQKEKSFRVSPMQLGIARQIFTAAQISDERTLKTIESTYKKSGIILDPHTAVGMAAALELEHELPDPVVVLGCAHPAKFPDTIERALGRRLELTHDIQELLQKTERSTSLPADTQAVKLFIEKKVH